MTILVSGGLGFIGSNFIENFLRDNSKESIINIDNLGYAARKIDPFVENDRYTFYQINIQDKSSVLNILNNIKPRALINFAAETHVDRSIKNSDIFINSNILGVYSILEAVKGYLTSNVVTDFKVIQISTDEVFGSLPKEDKPFTEKSQYQPNSPYSSSKASSDQLMRAWFHTYNIPTIITNCSNNYGPYQYPEKLIPVVIKKAVTGQKIPIYGDGKNIRDWIYVDDHCDAINKILLDGKIGESYCIGGNAELSNNMIVNKICETLDQCIPLKNGSYKNLINYIEDRAGHDFRYAINSSKIRKELGWEPKYNIDKGLKKTIKWYLSNMSWLKNNG